MTVKQLIEKLKTFPPDSTTLLEGCDCLGIVSDVVPPVSLPTNKRLYGETLPADFVLICRKEDYD